MEPSSSSQQQVDDMEASSSQQTVHDSIVSRASEHNDEMRQLESQIDAIGNANKSICDVVSDLLEDTIFSQYFGGLSENVEEEIERGDGGAIEVNERSSGDDDDDDDYKYDVSDDCEEFHDSDYEMQEDDDLFEKNVDHSVEFAGLQDKGKKHIGDSIENIDDNLRRKYGTIDCMDSGDDVSAHDSDEDSMMKWPVFNPRTEMENPNLEVGMLFSTKQEFKEAVQNWSILRGKIIKFVKNDKRRCRVICRRENCPYCIYISKHEGGESWQIRSLQEHTCSWTYHNKTLNSSIIAKKFANKIRVNPKLKCKDFRKEVMDDLKLHVSKAQARKAVQKALQLIHLKLDDQFKQI